MQVLQSKWLNVVPRGTVQGGIEFLNSLSWAITLEQQDSRWKAYAGEHLLVAADSEAEREAFLIGMTIGLAVLPGAIIAQIKKLVAE